MVPKRLCSAKKVKLRSCRYRPVFPRRSRFVLGMLWDSGSSLGKPFAGNHFRLVPYRFCSDGNGVTLSALLWSHLILSDTHNMTFHGQWHMFRLPCQPSYSGRFACLGSHSSIANRTGVSLDVMNARCCNCSSKPCGLFHLTHLRAQLYSKGCIRTTTLGLLPASRVWNGS